MLSFPQLARPAPDVAMIQDGALSEISGCARSHRANGELWAHNDSGNPAVIYRLDARGEVRARVPVPDAPALDWEDIAAFSVEGRPYLAIADTGDNFALRERVAVLLLPEPEPGASAARPERVIEFQYADGPRDVEALAVDVAARQILLLEKRRPPATLYALDLDGPDRQIAQPIARLADWWPERPTPVEPTSQLRYRGAAAAMDLSPDGRRLALLTSTHWAVFTRAADEPWSAVLARPPQAHARLPRRQLPVHDTIFEALCWASNEVLWISGERLPAPLLRVSVPSPKP